MTELFALEPEVAGGWGPGTIVTNNANIKAGIELIPNVVHLEYRFDGWLGDELLTFISTFIVTERLAQAIDQANLMGCQFEPVKISISDEWAQLDRVQQLPNFKQLIPLGMVHLYEGFQVTEWSGHDFCWGMRDDYEKPSDISLTLITPPPYCLVVSRRALNLLQQYPLTNCDIYQLGPQ